ncbi:hypothetical protein NQ315_001626 [Exocentrus adspersus]|uniref:Dynein regulatory complex subunit 2 n=1 Tax=Exocentrus adspersus TaxID=1586481 RepID=A0AAV8W9A1_9CUCU|nr:hypothetical protein NQ315_001626 [Exocentrus adspersus]
MAGAKKKTLANKLAKMSDEERARYLQHKADMEEEAKRRKEQLIATFMKKEDAFSRLNLAKINQNWHQILRRLKCQEMKENVGHLRLWIERLLDYKNRTISKLMDELEEAEEQYSNNYQCHSTHVDDIIGDQQKYMEKLEAEFDDDLFELLQTTQEETETISNNSKDQEEHLMTVLYGQETEGAKTLREQYETNMTKLYEVETSVSECFARVFDFIYNIPKN